MELQNSTVLVTGATGNMALHVTDQIIQMTGGQPEVEE